MSLTLYWNLGSQPARAVKCLLDLGKISAKLVSLDVVKNETRSKEYMAINPLGQIPFLVDGDFKVGESNAILVYLCQKYPQTLAKFYGTTPQQRARVNQHLGWYQNFFRPAVFKLIYLKIYEIIRRKNTVYANQIVAAEKDLFSTIGQFEQLLKHNNTSFVAGQSLTIADLQYYFELTNMILYEKNFSQYKLVSTWYNRVGEVPEVKSIQDEWSKLVPLMVRTLKGVPIKQNSKL